MAIYDLMQLSPGILRQKIREAPDRPTKRRLLRALVLRDGLLLGFAVAYIAGFTQLFGPASSYLGVASFCILLSARFVNYTYNARASLGALAVVLGLMWGNSVLLPRLGVGGAGVVNLLSLLVILRLTTAAPIMGNGGVYTFGYVLVTGVPPVGTVAVTGTGLATLAAYLCCAAVFWKHHRHADAHQALWPVVKPPRLTDATWRWQLRLALGVTVALMLGQALHHQRAMWLGFACMSVLLPQTTQLRGRAVLRFSGVVLGSLMFALGTAWLPVAGVALLAPLAGFGLGLTPSYFWASILNCFGALSIVYLQLGGPAAAGLRIMNNGLGILTAVGVAAIGGLLARRWQR